MSPAPTRVSRRRTARPDEGFTMVEVLVAMVIVAVVMASMIGVLLSALTTVVQARQRQTATGLATQALEQLRALPYNDITLDNGSSPDPGLLHLSGSGPYDFEPTTVLPGVDERLVVNVYSGRWEDVPVDEVTYRVSTYVTRPAIAAGAPQTFNLTTLVTWTSAAYPGARTAAQRSTTYSPAGCLSTAQSPFAAPCQAHFTGTAGTILGGVSVTDAVDSTAPVTGFGSGASLELNLADMSSTVLVEQTASATASAQTSSAAGPTTSGGASTSVAVDSDPSSATGQSGDATIAGHTSGAQQLTGIAGTLKLRPSTGDSGGAAAAIAAPASICTGIAGALATGSPELRPCSAARVQPAGTASSLTWEPPAAFGFGGVDVPMVQIANSGTQWRSVTAQLTSSNFGACTSGSGPGALGCSHAAATRSLGTVLVGATGADASAVPAGWDPAHALWSVTGLTETARAEDGTGAQLPLYQRTGTVRVWNGTGYTPYDLSAGTPASVLIAPVSLTYTGSAGTSYYVTFEGSVDIQPWETVRTPATRTGDAIADCKVDTCITRVSGGGAVVGSVTVTITTVPYPLPPYPLPADPPGMVGRFTIGTNLGGLLAQATYRAAPNA